MSGLGRLTLGETKFIGMVLEGLCYGENFCSAVIKAGMVNYACLGLYSALFCMYMQYHASKELEIDKKNILLYALCILYILSTATVVLDVTRNVTVGNFLQPLPKQIFYLHLSGQGLHLTPNSPLVQLLHLLQVSITLTGLCDFISQIILVCQRAPAIFIIYFLFISIFKDLSMLGNMGSQNPCHNYSVNFSACVFGSVNSILYIIDLTLRLRF